MSCNADPLTNYLKTFRKKAGLTQADLETLFGLKKGTVSRHESGERCPPLEVLLAYEFLYDQPASCLFAGVARAVQQSVTSSAKTLLPKVENLNRKRERGRVESLRRLAQGSLQGNG